MERVLLRSFRLRKNLAVYKGAMEEIPPPPKPVATKPRKRCQHDYSDKWHCPVCSDCVDMTKSRKTAAFASLVLISSSRTIVAYATSALTTSSRTTALHATPAHMDAETEPVLCALQRGTRRLLSSLQHE